MFHFQSEVSQLEVSQLNFSIAVFKCSLKQMFYFQLDCGIIATSQLNFSLTVFNLAVFTYLDSLVDL